MTQTTRRILEQHPEIHIGWALNYNGKRASIYAEGYGKDRIFWGWVGDRQNEAALLGE